MSITPIMNFEYNGNSVKHSKNQPSFKALQLQNTCEMKDALVRIKTKAPSLYKSILDAIKTLEDTKFFNACLTTVNNNLRLMLSHSKNFVWPGRQGDILFLAPYVILEHGETGAEACFDCDKLHLIKQHSKDDTIQYDVYSKDPRREIVSREIYSQAGFEDKIRLIKLLDDLIKILEEKGSYRVFADKSFPYHPLPTPEQLEADIAARESDRFLRELVKEAEIKEAGAEIDALMEQHSI